jgi:hypothetical protein
MFIIWEHSYKSLTQFSKELYCRGSSHNKQVLCQFSSVYAVYNSFCRSRCYSKYRLPLSAFRVFVKLHKTARESKWFMIICFRDYCLAV